MMPLTYQIRKLNKPTPISQSASMMLLWHLQ